MRRNATIAISVFAATAVLVRADEPVQRGTARGHIEFSTAAPLVMPPENPGLRFELKKWIAIVPPQPPDEIKDDPIASSNWRDAWRQTEEGKKWVADAARQHEAAPRIPFELKPDNTFDVPDVPFGQYTVRVSADDLSVKDRLRASSYRVYVGVEPPADVLAHRPSARVVWQWGKGDLAPDVPLEFFRGDSKTLADMRGKTVVLHFWGTWCGPCVAELPQWKQLRAELAGRDDIAIIDVNCGDEVDKAESFMKENNYDWPLASNGGMVDNGPVTGPFGITGYPSVAVIDPEGRVVMVRVGTVEQVRQALPKAIQRE